MVCLYLFASVCVCSLSVCVLVWMRCHVPHSLVHLNTWSPVGSLFWVDLGGMAMCHWSSFEVSRDTLCFCLWFKMWALCCAPYNVCLLPCFLTVEVMDPYPSFSMLPWSRCITAMEKKLKLQDRTAVGNSSDMELSPRSNFLKQSRKQDLYCRLRWKTAVYTSPNHEEAEAHRWTHPSTGRAHGSSAWGEAKHFCLDLNQPRVFITEPSLLETDKDEQWGFSRKNVS